MKITKPSLTELLICEQTDDTGIPASPTFYEVRGKSEAATSGTTKEESGEFSDNNAVTELIKTSTEPKQPFTINLTGDASERILLEAALSGDFDADSKLKAGLTDKLIACRRVIINDKGSYVTDIENCVVNLNLSIVGKQLNSASVDCQGTRITKRNLQLGYMASGTPNKIFGGDGSGWLNTADGKFYKRTLRTWATTASNPSNAFTTGKKWTAVTTDPTVTTGAATWILNKVNGKIFWDTGVALSVPSLIFTWLPDGTTWLSGTAAPTSSDGGRDSLWLITGDGTALIHGGVYQKIFNGVDDVWTLIMSFNLTALADTPWYAGNTITAKSTNAVMTFPQLRNLAVMDLIGTKCVNDLSLSIDNGFTQEYGRCTSNIGINYPHYGAMGISRGKRKITGKFSSYFYDDELDKIESANSTLYFEFMLSNGTQAYRIQIPKANLEGDPQSGNATDSSVKADYNYTATVDTTFDTEMQVEYIADVTAYPPLYWGWVNDAAAIDLTTDHLEEMTNYLGNIKIPTKPSGSWYFVICTPDTEPSITSLINTDTGLSELADYAEAVATQELVTGVDYHVNASADTSTVPTASEIFIINR